MWHLKYHTYELIYETHIDIENKIMVAKGRVGRGGIEWEFEVSRFKLLHIEWIKTRSYSTAQETILSVL